MVKLIIDVGNSCIKLGIFDKCNIISFDSALFDDKNKIINIVKKYNVNSAIISSVIKNGDVVLEQMIRPYVKKVSILNHTLKLPFENFYETPETLGKDRVAAVAGAQTLFPGKSLLVIDAGTAITYDFLFEGKEYLGGNIAPGLKMRLKSLNTFTDRLPLVEINPEAEFPAKNTFDAIASGAFTGMIFEIEGYMEFCRQKWGEIKTIITGGDSLYFGKKLKKTIFVNQNLVLLGLNRILEYNE